MDFTQQETIEKILSILNNEKVDVVLRFTLIISIYITKQREREW
jgi:hypothetical protein